MMVKRNTDEDKLAGVYYEVHWTPLMADGQRHPLQCIDGRYTSARVGAPGGDIGEFLLIVAALEQLDGQPRPARWIKAALDVLFDTFGPFHMHTDEIALSQLAAAYAAESGDELSLDQIKALICHPEFDHPEPDHPEFDQRSLLEDLLTRPGLQGCGHINAMMHDPLGYQIDLGSIEQTLRVFYHRLWQGSPTVELEILQGVHTEESVVVVKRVADADLDGLVAAMAVDNDLGTSIFIEHPCIRHEQRRRFLDELVRHSLINADDATSSLWAATVQLEEVHRDKTIAALCPDLPVHRIDVGIDPSAYD